MTIFFSELVGTMILMLLGNGAVANVLLNESKGKDSGWIVIATGWGFAVAIAIYIVGMDISSDGSAKDISPPL